MRDLIERQKVIDALKDWYDGMIISSFRGVEKVIKALPSAQPKIEERKEESAQNVPKEDLISRKAAIDYCYQLINVEHQQGSDEMNYRQERVNQTEVILHHLEFMPSAQPKREKGEWTKDCACEICGFKPWYERDIHTLSFCPNCGADMREDQDG